jgi:hypothetical protein
MANPFSKITEFFKSFAGSESRGSGKTYPNKMNYLYGKMAVENDRKKIYQECWVMYNEDARISAAIDTTAGSATNGAFTLKFNNIESDESVLKDAEEIMSLIIKRAKLKGKISAIAKELLILGDVFLEVIVDFNNNEIADLKKLPARTIERQEDEYGNLIGFVQRDDIGQIIAIFEPWQILHMRWNNFTGQMYGTSMLRGIRLLYKKLKMTEEDLVIRRRTRAGLKLHHYGASAEEPLEEDEVEDYIKLNNSTAMNVRTDFYSNGKWKIDVLKSDDGVAEIDDVKHLENALFVGLRTPKGLLGIGEETNKATLERQEVAYIRLLNEICEVIGEQIRHVFDIGLQLKAIDPNNIEYDLLWKEKTIEDMNSKVNRLILQANGGFISKETATNEMGYNFEDEMHRIEKEMDKYDFLAFDATKFLDPNSMMQSSREKLKHQGRTDSGKENKSTQLSNNSSTKKGTGEK